MPYGPYPPHGQPYPGQPYPPGGPYPPTYPPQPGYPSHGSYPPAPVDECSNINSRNWTAFIKRMPGPDARPQLVVSGTVRTPTGGYQLRFDPNLTLRQSYPVQAVAVLRVIPPRGPATQAVETHDVRWQWPLRQQVGSVDVVCGSRTLARISPVQRAY
jgi:hypothetical protein